VRVIARLEFGMFAVGQGVGRRGLTPRLLRARIVAGLVKGRFGSAATV
jgi:hypothetical protein